MILLFVIVHRLVVSFDLYPDWLSRQRESAGSAAPLRYRPGGNPLRPLSGSTPVPGRDWGSGGATGPRREGLM